MVFPLLAPLLLSGGSYLAGKSSSGGGIEIGTSKKENANISVVAPFSPFIYQPTNAQDYSQVTITGSPNASVNTKKDIAGASAPISYALPIELGQSQGSGSATGESAGGSGIDFMTIAIFGGLGVGAYMLINKGGKK